MKDTYSDNPIDWIDVKDNVMTIDVNEITNGTGQSFINFRAGTTSKGYFGYTTLGDDGMTILDAPGSNALMLMTGAGRLGLGGQTSPNTSLHVGKGVTSHNLTNAENSNPASNPTTNFAVQVVTTTPSDATWLNKWVEFKDLTAIEKKENPGAATCEGLLKTWTYKEAWANFWRDTDETNRKKFLALPSFDTSIFKEITGIDVGENSDNAKKKAEILAKIEELKIQANNL